MTKIDIFSGFLGAGKTTLIKKMIEQAYKGERLVLIENEFGEIGIDGGFLAEAGIQINEMNSGCICCSLVGDFGKALTQVITGVVPGAYTISVRAKKTGASYSSYFRVQYNGNKYAYLFNTTTTFGWTEYSVY